MLRQQGGGKQMMNFGRSRARVANGDEIKVTFEDVAGADEEKAELKEVVDFMRDPTVPYSIGPIDGWISTSAEELRISPRLSP